MGYVRRFKCWLGLHRGNVHPAHEIGQEIEGQSAFVCTYCGAVIENVSDAFDQVERVRRLSQRV